MVEDQSALRVLLCEMLSREGWETAQASDASEATRLFTEFDPDVLLTDIDLGSRPSGAELALMLSGLAPHMGIVFLSSYPRAAAGARAMGIDHAVFVAKQDLGSASDLVLAIEKALSTHPAPTATVASEHAGLGALTRHQLDILAMIAKGWSNDHIAGVSGSSVRAVERSISRIFERLEVTGDATISPRVAAAAMYMAAFGPSR
ncbi:DNA-binding response regulator, NarL/FixJ family, contains REC and HTH domains [Agreia bicolorata]|uniref:DNA-binding response regulator, NarL/FixJ family, contains REC and HTH domains n=1 Tax=Agreia bicolorata TaxID=110935 RepID=A0A1T4WT26_9MICO|nr:DNA-binding response regulator, NarL/FixJ family, contains REC and HTH domains [Agreia bicolorata]